MKKMFALFLLILLSSVLWAQTPRNSVTGYAVGNFNGAGYVYLDPHIFRPNEMFSTNKSALGGAVEYDFNYTKHFSVGALWEANPSDGKLLCQGCKYSIWPQTHYEALALFTQTAPFPGSNFSIFIQEGAGAIVTNGHKGSGVSHDIAFATGLGVDYRLSEHWSARVGALFLDYKSGCYNGRACEEGRTFGEDAHAGIRYSW